MGFQIHSIEIPEAYWCIPSFIMGSIILDNKLPSKDFSRVFRTTGVFDGE